MIHVLKPLLYSLDMYCMFAMQYIWFSQVFESKQHNTLTLLHGATQYTIARKGSPIATPKTTKNLMAVVCCLSSGRFSYHIDKSCCWQLGWATNCLGQEEVFYDRIRKQIMRFLFFIFTFFSSYFIASFKRKRLGRPGSSKVSSSSPFRMASTSSVLRHRSRSPTTKSLHCIESFLYSFWGR